MTDRARLEAQDGARETPTLTRYGIAWHGPRLPIGTPMPDGYWTPWHIAQAEITRLQSALANVTANRDGMAELNRERSAKLQAEQAPSREDLEQALVFAVNAALSGSREADRLEKEARRLLNWTPRPRRTDDLR